MLVVFLSALLFAINSKAFGIGLEKEEENNTIDLERLPLRKRVRKFVLYIMNELGPYYTRRAYWMHDDLFWDLHCILKPHIKCGQLTTKEGSLKKNKNNGAPNGIIFSPLRLSAALRWFAGGDPLDIQLLHGISHTEVFNSVWLAIDAINLCPELKFEFPYNHQEQLKIAEAFWKRSRPDFDMCVRTFDGIVIWMEMPTLKVCEKTECGRIKFYYDRKKKYGLNMQSACDANCRYLDCEIGHPASTSDYLAFSTGELHKKLENGLMREGLCLFGDNAYVNTSYVATPFAAVKNGTKDDYNFYHSQVRIKIKCAFGQLVNRWGVLRKLMLAHILMQKVTALC